MLSYLTANPAKITAVDLNPAHVALLRLKLAGLSHLPGWDEFYRFFGEADEAANMAGYRRYLRPNLDETTRRYWEKRSNAALRTAAGETWFLPGCGTFDRGAKRVARGAVPRTRCNEPFRPHPGGHDRMAQAIARFEKVRAAQAAMLAKAKGGLTGVGFVAPLLASGRVRRVDLRAGLRQPHAKA